MSEINQGPEGGKNGCGTLISPSYVSQSESEPRHLETASSQLSDAGGMLALPITLPR